MPSVSQIVNSLPRPIRLRFDSLGRYVQTLIAEEEESLQKAQHLTQEEVDLVKLLTFCHAAHVFFSEGAEAARLAVDEFKRFDIPGFQVGSTLFEGRNTNVMLGDTLAAGLMDALGDHPLFAVMGSARTVKDIVHSLSRKIRHERRLD